MTNTVRIKRRAAGGAAGAPASLQNAELAFNEQDLTLYYGVGTGGSGGSATTIIPIGGNGAFVDLSTNQTIGGTKIFSNAISGSITGNAGTATVLQTARTINGTSFNGSTNITITASTTNTLTIGSYLTGTSFNGSSAVTIAVDATNLNTASKVVARDASGNFSAGTITAALAGNATTATGLAATADVTINNFKLINLADATAAQDAVNLRTMQSYINGIAVKPAVRGVATTNQALTGLPVNDGVTFIAADLILLTAQSTGSQNGPWVVAAGAWARPTWWAAASVQKPALFYVTEGTVYHDTKWTTITDGNITVDTTSISITQDASGGTYTAGNGLQLVGGQFSVLPDGTSLSVSGTGTRISATYAGQSSIVTLGTVTTGVWSGTAIGVAFGGTGLSAAVVGLLKGNGTAYAAATAGTDYLDPNSTVDGGTF